MLSDFNQRLNEINQSIRANQFAIEEIFSSVYVTNVVYPNDIEKPSDLLLTISWAVDKQKTVIKTKQEYAYDHCGKKESVTVSYPAQVPDSVFNSARDRSRKRIQELFVELDKLVLDQAIYAMAIKVSKEFNNSLPSTPPIETERFTQFYDEERKGLFSKKKPSLLAEPNFKNMTDAGYQEIRSRCDP